MTEGTEFIIGVPVACSDGVCGELRRVVIDPVAQAITHLVVEPEHWNNGGHLAPVDLVVATGAEIRLRCTTAEFEALEEAEDTRFLPGPAGGWEYDEGEVLSLPYFRLGSGEPMTGGPDVAISHRVPAGEVEVRRGDHVDATDGHLGRVRGLVVDPGDHHVTHVLVEAGHLWRQSRVAIPIGAVKQVGEVVKLTLTKDEVRALPSVDADDPG